MILLLTKLGLTGRENLTGYLNRLGWTHHVPPRALVAQEIVPRLEEGSRLAAPVGVFGTKWDIVSFSKGTDFGSRGLSLENLLQRTDP
jgi:hypothetical protein